MTFVIEQASFLTQDIDLYLLLLVDQSDALDDRDAILSQCKYIITLRVSKILISTQQKYFSKRNSNFE